MFPSIIRRAAQPKIPFDLYTNPYKAKRLWPPDFSKISPKHQFRLERRYKRRAKLKWARPRWTKAVKIVQLSSVIFITVYGVLFLDWSQQAGSDSQPFQGVRNWFFGLTGSMWTKDQLRRRSDPDEGSPVANTSN